MSKNNRKENKLNWSALFAGAIGGVGLNFLLNLLALAIGLSSFSIAQDGSTRFSFAGYSLFCFSAFIAMFFTGWLAGKLSSGLLLKKTWGMVHGFLAWCLLLLFTVMLITNLIQYTAFHANFTSNLVGIKISANSPMVTETQSEHKGVSAIPDTEKAKKILRINSFQTFFLFLTGALASCLGGYLGFVPGNLGKPYHESS
ncbi:hypothetical protein [Legionella genomosp. 1]|uniref:hypothetical protein n=1 Tax=Legionella genomosp. 1 TaxID=1093625 RepID=UPI0010561AAE|nr:hypothetical protein [Legionella genomosp. 1]